MFLTVIKAIFTILCAVPIVKGGSIGRVAGNGGWGDEDADHLKK